MIILNYVATVLNKSVSVQSIVSIHYFEYTADFAYPGESHDFWEIIYCDKGILRIVAGQNEYQLSAGQAFLHMPMQFHSVRVENDEPANSIILSFYSDCDAIYQVADKIICTDSFTADALFSILREAKASFSNQLGKVADAQLFRKPKPDRYASEQIIQNYIELLLIHLIRKANSSDDFPELPRKNLNSPVIDKICDYLKQNYAKKITYEKLTAEFSISPTTLKNLFKKYLQCGAIEYLTRIRLERSKEMLREGKYSCTEIAYNCGFCSIHHFSKVFKDNFGMTPTEYIKSVKSLLEEAIQDNSHL